MLMTLKNGHINKTETVFYPTATHIEYFLIYHLDNYYVRLQFDIFDVEEIETILLRELILPLIAMTIPEEDFCITMYNLLGASSYYEEYRPKGVN